MDNIITMRREGNNLVRDADERWVSKPQTPGSAKKKAKGLGRGIHKKKGVYWYDNRKIKDIVAFCRREGLIVAPDANLGPNDRGGFEQ